ncbi:MAG: sigma-70 family RNA polymerase sigma factor [Lachnospiraceae bacterium]|nr:sigma-70 family RNA polymerase sigma factor [Lachnospiraceae bacterium]MBR1524542.1 sigma-70 family RNA polymerase sigma factor [Lachnospiraceae bacterium]
MSDYSDEEIIENVREGEASGMDELFERYKNVVRSIASTMYLIGGETEDLIQEGMIGLFKAVQEYDPGRDASFGTFARLCITRQIYSAVKASGRKKHIPLNTYVSLYEEKKDEDESGRSVEVQDMLRASDATEPEHIVLSNEKSDELERAIESELSPMEKNVLELYVTGMSYSDIADVLGKNEKAMDNAIQRIRGKLKRYL